MISNIKARTKQTSAAKEARMKSGIPVKNGICRNLIDEAEDFKYQ